MEKVPAFCQLLIHSYNRDMHSVNYSYTVTIQLIHILSTNHALTLYQNASTTETLLDSSTNQNQRRFHKGPITFHKGS